MRVYLPGTIAMLRQLLADGKFTPVGGTGFALTPALREAYASGSDEELEYSVMVETATASIRLLAIDGAEEADTDPLRRVVVVAEVENATIRSDLDAAVVKVSGPVSMAEIDAIHVDTAEAEEAVAAAVKVIDTADLGDLDAEFVVGEATDHELAWYAAQELPFLLELL